MLAWLEQHKRSVITGVCVLGALRIFVFGAALPPFHPVDEAFHFDLVIKYASGHVPYRLEHERFSPDTRETIVLYGTGFSLPRPDSILLYNSPEYLTPAAPEGVAPPVWTAPDAVRAAALPWGTARWDIVNYEAMEPPAYYGLAGAWYRLGKWLGLRGGHLFYWTRFLNSALFVGVVWLAHRFARDFYPGNRFLAQSVPLLVAAVPQDAFYGVTNDGPLTPLLFGGALYCLLRCSLPRRAWPVYGLAGLLVAATLLTKYSNVAIVVPLLITVFSLLARPSAAPRRRDGAWKVLTLLLAATLPVVAWLTRNTRLTAGPTGSYQKYAALGWSLKGLDTLWDHPFFGRDGLIQLVQPFGHGLLSTLWRGEIVWHRAPMALPSLDRFYSISSTLFLAFAIVRLVGASSREERRVTWTCVATVIAAVASLAVLSTLFDFGHRTLHPTPSWPYFTSGRLLTGILVPFATTYLYGLEWAFARARLHRLALAAVGAMVVLITALQIAFATGAFESRYNWFHLPWRVATGTTPSAPPLGHSRAGDATVGTNR